MQSDQNKEITSLDFLNLNAHTASLQEMAKVVIVFKGNYGLEKSLDPSITGFDYLGLQGYCSGCTVNAFAAKGYVSVLKQLTLATCGETC